MNPELNISLEPHLQNTLNHIVVHLPKPLSEQLDTYLNVQNPSQPTPTIPYSLLQSISQWSRTPSGLASLNGHDPSLSPHDYTMIALLAGTTTSPERKFPAYTPPDPHADRKREYKDRKAVTAVLNALLSILGSGAATWWAAERTGWRPEWKALLSFVVAAVVAASETILYIIWESRRSAKSRPKPRRLVTGHKKDDEDRDTMDRSLAVPIHDEAQQHADGLRQRVISTEPSR